MKDASESMSYDVDFGIGTAVQLELKFTDEDYRFPFLWIFPVSSTATQYTQSIADGRSWSIAGFVALEDDIDATDEERVEMQERADRIMNDFIGQLRLADDTEGNYFNSVSYSFQAEFRNTDYVASGYGFNITANSDNLYDFCC